MCSKRRREGWGRWGALPPTGVAKGEIDGPTHSRKNPTSFVSLSLCVCETICVRLCLCVHSFFVILICCYCSHSRGGEAGRGGVWGGGVARETFRESCDSCKDAADTHQAAEQSPFPSCNTYSHSRSQSHSPSHSHSRPHSRSRSHKQQEQLSGCRRMDEGSASRQKMSNTNRRKENRVQSKAMQRKAKKEKQKRNPQMKRGKDDDVTPTTTS